MAEINEVRVHSAVKTITIRVKLRGLRIARLRIRLAVPILRLGAWVAGTGFEVAD